MTNTATQALTFDEILEQGTPTQETVWICLNGRLRAEYEEVAERIAGRTADWEAAREAAKETAEHRAAQLERATEPGPDDRLTSRPPAADVPEVPDEGSYVDPEQAHADELVAGMKRYTVPFVLVTVGERYNELIEAHPPRRDPADAKKIDPRDYQGYNSATFWKALIREAIESPEMTDERWEKLLNGKARLSDVQWDKLANAALRVNRQDYDIPFSPDDLESPPR